MTDAKVTIARETLQRWAETLSQHVYHGKSEWWVALNEMSAALRAEQPVAAQPATVQPAEPVACLIRYRSCTPARVAHDKHVHWHDWSKWDIATLAHGKAVTDPSRNPTEDDEWQMQPLYAAQSAPAAVPLTDARIVELFRETFLAHADPMGKDNMTIAFARAIERAHGIAAAGDKLCGG